MVCLKISDICSDNKQYLFQLHSHQIIMSTIVFMVDSVFRDTVRILTLILNFMFFPDFSVSTKCARVNLDCYAAASVCLITVCSCANLTTPFK